MARRNYKKPARGKQKTRRTSTRKKRSAKREKCSVFGFLFKWGFIASIWACLFLAGLLAWYAKDLPTVTESMIFERRPTIIIKDKNGDIIQRYGDLKGESVSVEDLPSHLIYAILAIEDRRFYNHFGIDVIGIGRAFLVNLRHGEYLQGGSTITQQLAKNLFLSRERTLKRKIQEAMLALWIERTLTKDEILSAYLNRVYLGAGAYGVDAASRIYFAKPASDLNLRESATIAGILKAPSRFSPTANPGLSQKRTRVVLNAMVDAGFIDENEAGTIGLLPPPPKKKPSSGDTSRYFTDYVVSQLDDLIGFPSEDIIVETTFDQNIQNAAETALMRQILEYGEARHVSQGAALTMRLDGAIVSMVGGRNYDSSEFNRTINSFRSPGSSFKPIVYLTALENGWDMRDTIMDAPITEGKYRPGNFKDEYYGEVSLYEALTLSLNTVAVNLAKDVTPDRVIGMARRLGIKADLERGLSTALGSNGVPMIEMVRAYTTIARGGLSVEPYMITKIETLEGETLYQKENRFTAHQVVDRKHVHDLHVMMESVIDNGTGRGAKPPENLVPFTAGKTGTSQEFRDAWFIGFTDLYASGIWVGNDDNSPMRRVTGGFIPAMVWRDVMRTAHENPYPRSVLRSSMVRQNSFQSLLGRIMGTEIQFSATPARPVQEEQEKSRPAKPRGDEYTPTGRHQWDLNQ